MGARKEPIVIEHTLEVDVSPPKATRDPRNGLPSPAQRRYAKSLGLDPDRYDASSISFAIDFAVGQTPADPSELEALRPGSLVLPRKISEFEAERIQDALEQYELWCPICEVPLCYEDLRCELCKRPLEVRLRVVLAGVDGVAVPGAAAAPGSRQRRKPPPRRPRRVGGRARGAFRLRGMILLALGVAGVLWWWGAMGGEGDQPPTVIQSGPHNPVGRLRDEPPVVEAPVVAANDYPAAPPSPPEQSSTDASSRMAELRRQQAERTKFIEAARAAGVIEDVEFRSPVTTIRSGPHWATVDDRTREMICRAASDFARSELDGDFVAVAVVEAATGHEVARFEQLTGQTARLRHVSVSAHGR